MKYSEYDIDDFLTDEFFIQWIKCPDENKDKIQNLFEVRERDRLAKGILSRKNSATKVKGLEKFGIGINVPASYQFVKEGEIFFG